jgi:hypothetical protein
MNTFRLCALILALAIMLSACTKKDNLTGTNWSEVNARTFTDELALVGGYSFAPDTLVSTAVGRKSILVGNWQGSEAEAVLRFTGLPQSATMDTLIISEAKLEFVLNRRNAEAAERNDLNLKLFKLNRSYTEPDSLTEADYSEFATLTVLAGSGSGDTLSVALQDSWLKAWQTDADSTGLNILIKLQEGTEGFVELKLSKATEGSRLSYQYQDAAADEIQDFSTYATQETFSFSHPGAEISPNQWKLSNFNPQRMFVDLQPQYELFKDTEGNTLDPDNLKRANINKAELVLFIDKDAPNLSNALSYYVSAFLVKDRPDSTDVIATTNMETIVFAYPLVSYANNSADSLVINITPIIQAYTAGKKEAQGIVIMSTYERKDFGAIEFHHPQTALPEKAPYIRVKYTPPYL